MSEGAPGESTAPLTGTPPDADAPPPPRPVGFAWQPFTPRGVAAFGYAPWANLLLLALIVALTTAGAVLWFVISAWCPVVRTAVTALPASGVIERGELKIDWPAGQSLGSNPFLSLNVDQSPEGNTSYEADITVVFRQRHLQICSLVGCMVYPYASNRIIHLKRGEAEPWWGAWEPLFLCVIGLGGVVWLFVVWTVLATLYCPAVRLLAYFADRQLTWRGSWRIAAASLMPAAIFFAGATVLYGLNILDLPQFLTATALHLMIPWVYLIWSPLQLPRIVLAAPSRTNPFATEPLPSDPLPPPAPPTS